MSRLFGLLNALAWALAIVIAWTERRDPARPPSEAAPDGSAPKESAPPEATPVATATKAAPTSRPVENLRDSSTAARGAGSADAVGRADTTAPSAPVPPASVGTGGERTATTEPPTEPNGPSPTAAEPISPEPIPGRPIVGTGAPIVARSEQGRPIPTGAVAGDGTATCPPDHPVKGNASSMIYHQPGQPSYERTVAEFCFASEDAAEAAGYRAPRR